jgi:SAM-dependent methyltransferase
MRRPDAAQEWNRSVYSRSAVVADFAALTGLTGAEEYLCRRHLRSGMRILDMGVGAGRTTPFLSALGASYIGADYSPAMLEHCRQKFPAQQFVALDAAGAWPFAHAALDAVVFSFNGIDYLHPAAQRLAFLRECRRVLAPGGILLFSVHNPSALFIWTPKRPSPESGRVLSLARAAVTFARYFAALFFSSAFWRQDGTFVDPYEHLVTHAASPSHVVEETTAAGFTALEHVSGSFPASASRWTTPAFYFAFRRDDVPDPAPER